MSTTVVTSRGVEADLERFMAGLVKRNPGEPEFHQAVREVAESVLPYQMEHSRYREAQILERMTEPDRIVIFRVTWEDDAGNIRANRAWRVQFNNSIGPYKGGMRFHPSVTLSVLKFLGFEQCFKNCLDDATDGRRQRGRQLQPEGKVRSRGDALLPVADDRAASAHRRRHRCAGGRHRSGGREISYMFGQYKRMENRFTGILTGKGLSFGGSLVRTEATGYGCVYFAENMLNYIGEGLEGKTCLVSGSGNVAIYTVEKILQLGGKPITMSDSGGTIHDPAGIDEEKLAFVKDLKEVRRGRIREYAERYGVEYFEGARPWVVPCDVAFPCATQNELEAKDAEVLLASGCRLVAEGANMPCSPEAMHRFREQRILYAPGKAANAGGVAVSGLEQSQNALRISWSHEEVDERLQDIMRRIHDRCVEMGNDGNGWVDYVHGANLGGFIKVAEAMLAYGVV